ncbi:LOW QUALITY PROTEIN: hypothetical protein N5P37_002579, partial [Trichoderma harzianum]
CDNKLPNCSQCTRLNKKCPGSTEGLIFIHSSSRVSVTTAAAARSPGSGPSSKRLPHHLKRACADESNTKRTNMCTIPPSISSSAHEVVSRLAVEIGPYHLSPWTPHPWFLSIPRLSLSADFQSRMLLPFQAMKVAFRALPENDASLKAAAYKYYSSGLERHQAQLHQLVPWQRHQHLASILNLLLMSMALLEFEMMAPLATDSWFPHAYGALGLLEQVGPQGCQESPFFEIFWQLRFFMLEGCSIAKCHGHYTYFSVVPRDTIYSQDVIPRVSDLDGHREKTEFDHVIDTLLLEDNQTIKGETLGHETIEQRKISGVNLGHGQGATFNFARPDHIADFERIVRVLVNVRELVSASASGSDLKRQESLSTAILADSKHLMNQPFLPFNVGLQVTAAASLVAQYATNSMQKQEAAQLYDDWRGRFVLIG